jgi:hypothetical protein
MGVVIRSSFVLSCVGASRSLALSPPRVNNAAGDVEKRTMASGGGIRDDAWGPTSGLEGLGLAEVGSQPRNSRMRGL